jgi:cell volume regulation protein A
LEAWASLEIARHTLLSCGLILALGTVAGLLAQEIRTPDVAVSPES